MNILLKEFVNSSGGRIGGDYRVDQVNTMTTSPANPPKVTDQLVKTKQQGPNRFMYRSFARENEDEVTELPEKDKKKKHPKKPKKTYPDLKESSRMKMDELVDDIITKKSFDRDIVDKLRSSQVRLNGIPDLESIREDNPILIRKVMALKDIVEKNNATGEQKAIILNYLLSMDLTDIPQEYRSELKKKI
jgi:hypothetical protein